MKLSKSKKRGDWENTHSIYDELAKQRSTDVRFEHSGVARLHKTSTDTMDFFSSNPNDRIAWASESGIIPNP